MVWFCLCVCVPTGNAHPFFPAIPFVGFGLLKLPPKLSYKSLVQNTVRKIPILACLAPKVMLMLLYKKYTTLYRLRLNVDIARFVGSELLVHRGSNLHSTPLVALGSFRPQQLATPRLNSFWILSEGGGGINYLTHSRADPP